MGKISRMFFLLLSVSCFLFSSCGGITYYSYYKSFFLGEETFVIGGQVFSNHELTEPMADFTKITIKSRAVDGWEISGEKKSGNAFEINVTITSNGITLSKDTIDSNYTYKLGVLSTGASICFLDFYFDDELALSYHDTYNYCTYVYVIEPITLSGTEVREENIEWHHYNEYHYDCDFSKPGWYKIVHSEQPIGSLPEYSSGRNTKMFL
jgi:hypothetical protein